MEKIRKDETATSFWMRKMRNAIIDEAIKVAEDHTPRKHESTLSAYVTGHTISIALGKMKDMDED